MKAPEQNDNNPLMILPKAKFVVWAGSFEPRGKILLHSGIFASLWFEKEENRIPEDSKDRVAYRE